MLSSVDVILQSLLRVQKDLGGGLDSLKLGHNILLSAWVAIGVVFESELSELFPDVVGIGVRCYLEIRIVVTRRVRF